MSIVNNSSFTLTEARILPNLDTLSDVKNIVKKVEESLHDQDELSVFLK